MARSLGNMVIHLGIDAAGMLVGAKQGEKILNDLKGKATGFGSQISAALGGLGLAGALGWGFKLAAEAQTAQTAFEVLTGSAETASKMLGDLRTLAADTPLGFTGLQDNARVLLNFGVAAETILPSLQMLGDISGGDADKMARLSIAFGQISATGRLMGQDLLQLINAGFNPLQEISARTGRSMVDLKKDMEEGRISFQMVKEAFQLATSEGGRFHGMMDKMATTLSGRFAKLKDNASLVAMAFANELIPVAERLLEAGIQLTDWLKGLDAATMQQAISTAAMAAAFVAAMTIVPRIIAAIGTLVTAFKSLASAQAISMAFGGPRGWAMLAASLGAAVGAGIAVNSMFEKQQKEIAKTATSAQRLVDANNEIGKSFEALTTSGNSAAKDLAKFTDQMTKRGAELARELRKPGEIFADTIAEMQELLAMGAITGDTFARGAERARKELQESLALTNKINEATPGVGAAERNTMGGFSAVQAGMRAEQDRRKADEERKRQHEETNRLLDEANRIAKDKQGVTLKQVSI